MRKKKYDMQMFINLSTNIFFEKEEFERTMEDEYNCYPDGYEQELWIDKSAIGLVKWIRLSSNKPYGFWEANLYVPSDWYMAVLSNNINMDNSESNWEKIRKQLPEIPDSCIAKNGMICWMHSYSFSNTNTNPQLKSNSFMNLAKIAKEMVDIWVLSQIHRIIPDDYYQYYDNIVIADVDMMIIEPEIINFTNNMMNRHDEIENVDDNFSISTDTTDTTDVTFVSSDADMVDDESMNSSMNEPITESINKTINWILCD